MQQRFQLRAATVQLGAAGRPSDRDALNAAIPTGVQSSNENNAGSGARGGGSMLSFLGRNLPSLGTPTGRPPVAPSAAGAAHRRALQPLHEASPPRSAKKARITNVPPAGGPTWAHAAGAGTGSQAPQAAAVSGAAIGEALAHALANELLRQIDVAMATGYPGEEGDEEDIAALQTSLHTVLPSLLAAGEEGREHLGLLLSPVARRMQPPPLVKTGRPPRHLSTNNSAYGPPPGRGKKQKGAAVAGKKGRGRPPASAAAAAPSSWPSGTASEQAAGEGQQLLAATAAAAQGGRKRRSPADADEDAALPALPGGVAGTLLAAAAAAWDQEQQQQQTLAPAATAGVWSKLGQGDLSVPASTYSRPPRFPRRALLRCSRPAHQRRWCDACCAPFAAQASCLACRAASTSPWPRRRPKAARCAPPARRSSSRTTRRPHPPAPPPPTCPTAAAATTP